MNIKIERTIQLDCMDIEEAVIAKAKRLVGYSTDGIHDYEISTEACDVEFIDHITGEPVPSIRVNIYLRPPAGEPPVESMEETS